MQHDVPCGVHHSVGWHAATVRAAQSPQEWRGWLSSAFGTRDVSITNGKNGSCATNEPETLSLGVDQIDRHIRSCSLDGLGPVHQHQACFDESKPPMSYYSCNPSCKGLGQFHACVSGGFGAGSGSAWTGFRKGFRMEKARVSGASLAGLHFG